MNVTHMISLTLMCILGVLVIALIAKTPLIKSFFKVNEGYASPNVVAYQCPQGSKMYMYDGAAFCCNGTVNTDAYSLEKSCILPVTQGDTGFCTLGPKITTPSGSVIRNCGNMVSSNLTFKGNALCPPSKPNFSSANRCCSSAITADGSDCSNKANGTYCDVKPDNQLFQSAMDCNYLRLKETDTCPGGSSMGDVVMKQGSLSGMTIYNCSNHTNICYTDKLIAALGKMGKDTSSLISCSSPTALSPTSNSCSPTVEAAPVDLTQFYDKPMPANGCPAGLVPTATPTQMVCGCPAINHTFANGKCECPAQSTYKPWATGKKDHTGILGRCMCDPGTVGFRNSCLTKCPDTHPIEEKWTIEGISEQNCRLK